MNEAERRIRKRFRGIGVTEKENFEMAFKR